MDKRITRKAFEQARKTLERNQVKYTGINDALNRGEIAEAQAQEQIDAMTEANNAAMSICADYKHQQASIAAAALGSIKSPRKAKSSAANGKKGGRPKGSKNKPK